MTTTATVTRGGGRKPHPVDRQTGVKYFIYIYYSVDDRKSCTQIYTVRLFYVYFHALTCTVRRVSAGRVFAFVFPGEINVCCIRTVRTILYNIGWRFAASVDRMSVRRERGPGDVERGRHRSDAEFRWHPANADLPRVRPNIADASVSPLFFLRPGVGRQMQKWPSSLAENLTAYSP